MEENRFPDLDRIDVSPPERKQQCAEDVQATGFMDRVMKGIEQIVWTVELVDALGEAQQPGREPRSVMFVGRHRSLGPAVGILKL
jgi:hypothetical protein